MRAPPRIPRLHPLCYPRVSGFFQQHLESSLSQNQAAFELPPNEREPLNLIGTSERS